MSPRRDGHAALGHRRGVAASVPPSHHPNGLCCLSCLHTLSLRARSPGGGFNCQRKALAFLTVKQMIIVFLPLVAANGTHKMPAAWHWALSAFHLLEMQFAWIRRTEA